MSNTGIASRPYRWRDHARWALCFALALALHVGGAMALSAQWHDDADLIASAPVITLDFAPAPVAPAVTPTELPPDPIQSRPQPESEPTPDVLVEKADIEQPAPVQPIEKPDLTPVPVQQPELSVLPPPRPMEKRKEVKTQRRKQASLASAPATAERPAHRPAAPAPGASSQNPNAVSNWKSRLVAQLERYKRYPPEAQMRGDHGVVGLAFSVDRGGGVHHARIRHSSGSALLDRATLALLARAAPLPPPPSELPARQIAIEVPIRYNIQ